jgi:6-phosphogluconolactonase (cycloisomerase 2 family)
MAASANYVFVTGGKKITTYRRSATGTLSFSSQVDALANSGGPLQWNVFHLTLDRTASSLYSSQGDLFGEYDKSDTGRLTFLTNSEALGTYTKNLTFSHSDQFAYFAQCPSSEWRLFGYIRQPDGTLTRFDTGDTIPPNNGLRLCPSDIKSSALGYMAVAYGVAGYEGTHSIAVYRVTSSGELQYVSSITTEFIRTQSQLLTIQFDPTGVYLAAIGQKAIQLYKLSSTGILSKAGSALYPNTAFKDLKWDKSGHVYTISSTALYSFKLKNGQLAQFSSPRSVPNATSLVVVSLQ